MDDPATSDELDKATAAFHQHSFEDMMLWAICRIARRYPVELRGAFSEVFSSAAVEDLAQRAEQTAVAAMQVAFEAKELLVSVNQELDRLEARISDLDEYLDRVREKFKKSAVSRSV